MDARSIEILQQLKAEVWWPADHIGGPAGDFERDPDHPSINKARWMRMLGELTALNPMNRDVKKLRGIYDRLETAHNRQNRNMWLEAMLR